MVERERIGLRHIKALQPNGTVWDASVAGFGARRQKGEAVAYVLFYRTAEGRQRWHTIGRHGAPWTPDTARKEAARMLGLAAAGEDPARDKQSKRKAQTIAELCDLYLVEAEAGRVLKKGGDPKKKSTLSIDKGRIERHIKPLIGKLKVPAVSSDDVKALLRDIAAGKTAAKVKTKPRGVARVRGGKGTANRVVRLLGGIFSFAGVHANNPVHGVQQFRDGERKRPLGVEEYRALGAALHKAKTENVWPAAIAAVRFLAVTGWRSGEALALRWDEIDLERRTAWLGDSKTGKSTRPLSHAACDVLRELTRSGPLVFPATRGEGNVIMTGFKKMFKKIAKLGELPADVTPHVLRHSFASVGVDPVSGPGFSDLTIGALIGHKARTMTSKYSHFADPVLLAAADAVANRTAELMGEGKAPNQVVKLRRAGR